jgi:hypothetical protein
MRPYELILIILARFLQNQAVKIWNTQNFVCINESDSSIFLL